MRTLITTVVVSFLTVALGGCLNGRDLSGWIDERMRTTRICDVAAGESLDTGFFMGIKPSVPLEVGELVGKTPTDPWRGLSLYTKDGAAGTVSFESRFPVIVQCGSEPAKEYPQGAISVSLPAGGAAQVLTRFSQKEVGPGVDRTKFAIGAWYGFPKRREATERDVDLLTEGGMDHCLLGHGLPKRRELLDRLSQKGIAYSGRDVTRWWGGDGDRAGKMRETWPQSRFDALIDRLTGDATLKAMAMNDICDEPSALDMPYLGEAVAHWINRCPQILPYVNIYPNYAKVSWTTGDQRVNQLGTTNYAAHVETYCRTVPLDYICFDHYPFDDEPEKTLKREHAWYGNFEDVAKFCRQTGRDLWFIGQVNTKPKRTKFLTENNFRFQVNTLLAYGGVNFDWGTWQPSWWTNSVIAADGTPTEHFEKVRRINAEIHRLAPDYMRFRNVGTALLNFPKRGNVASFSNGVCSELKPTDDSKLVVGDMVARNERDGRRALYVFAADDMADVKRQIRTVRFRTSRRVRVEDGNGEVPVTRAADGSLSFRVRDCHGALAIFE